MSATDEFTLRVSNEIVQAFKGGRPVHALCLLSAAEFR